MSRSFDVVHVATEMTPVAKVGGLADVVEGLSGVLSRRGHRVTVILPGYGFLLDGSWEFGPADEVAPPAGDGAQEWYRLVVPGQPAEILVMTDAGFRRRNGVYADPQTGEPFPDDAERYARFALGVVGFLAGRSEWPDILHVHDHQPALLPSLVRRGSFPPSMKTVITLHNLAFQGRYPRTQLAEAGLDEGLFAAGGPLEHEGQVNFLKAGIVEADIVTTVSPRYAQEITRDAEFGCGLEAVLAARPGGVEAILNGIDTTTWNPAVDPHLAAAYDRSSLTGKQVNKEMLQRRTGLRVEPGSPVVGMVTRLTDQKGIQLVLDGAEQLLEQGAQLVVLGSGEKRFEEAVRDLAQTRRQQVAYSGVFDDPLAHLIQGGSDIFLMPSRFEPCGLTQMISLAYGTVPVVRRVGGLADTVQPVSEGGTAGTGFLFDEYSVEAMLKALGRALSAYQDREGWHRLMKRAMAQDFSWERAGAAYEELYRLAVGR